MIWPFKRRFALHNGLPVVEIFVEDVRVNRACDYGIACVCIFERPLLYF